MPEPPLNQSAIPFAGYAALMAFSIVSSIVDLRTRILPNRLLLAGGLGTLVWLIGIAMVTHDTAKLFAALSTASVMFLSALAFAMIGPRQLGGGDVKLAPVIGLILGWHGVLSTVVALVAMGFLLLVALALTRAIARRKRSSDGHHLIPLAPVAFLGMWCAIVLTPRVFGAS